MTSQPTPVALTPHRLRHDQFDALATGGGDAATVSELLAAERSWRLVQLRVVLDAARAHPDATGPLPPLDQAWELLTAAQRHAPSEVESLLLHPQAGTWAGYALRRLRGSTITDAPVWVDIGYLHALAAAAGARAGLDFAIQVPVREGFVSLPTLGGAFLPGTGRWDTAEIRGPGDPVIMPASRVGTWTTLPALRAEAGGHTLAVTLDHLDPYRNLRAPAPPDRLSPAHLERWRALLAQAWTLVTEVSPGQAGAMAKGLFSVVPQPAAERFRTMSASAGDAFGSMTMSEPADAPELAVTLVHEFQHIKLGGLLHLTPLQHAEPPQRLYAPWRDDPRPLNGLLQGVYAFVGITEFWRGFRQVADGPTARLAHFEFARWRRQVWRTLRTLTGLPELTAVGQRLVTGLTKTAAAWQDEPVPAEILAPAEEAIADHRSRWRLHHLRPHSSAVAASATAWAAGADRPRVAAAKPAVAPDSSARRLDTRAVLALWRLTDPDGFAQLRDPAAADPHVSGATAADLAYAAGDLDQARALFLAELASDPNSPGAWAGLGLVATAVGSDSADALRDEPELVRAIHREPVVSGASPADPLALASWLGRGRPSPPAG